MAKYELVIITGPTASGKTSLAASLALRIGGEVISADSRQVYRGMDIGTGKDMSEYEINGKVVPVHLIDIADPGYKYNVFEYQRDFLRVFDDIKRREKFPVVCGGSGMYIDSIVSGYRLIEVPPDEELRSELEKKPAEELKKLLESYRRLHNVTDLDTKKRVIRAIEIEQYYLKNKIRPADFPRVNPLIVAISFDREERRKRISERLRERLGNGMIDEVRKLMEKGISSEMLIYYGLEYKYITFYLNGSLGYDEMYRRLEIAIHQYAKRQMTWFRGMERKGIKINWIDGKLPVEKKLQQVISLLQ